MTRLGRGARLGGRAIAGAACAVLLYATPIAFAQGQTTGANGTVSETVPPGTTGGTITVTTGAGTINVTLGAPVTSNGQPTAAVVTVVPQAAASVLGCVSNVGAAGSNPSAATIAVQTPTGQPIANVAVQVSVPAGTTVFAVVNCVLQPLAVVNGVVTVLTNAQGQLNLVLGATLAAPTLPAPVAVAQAPQVAVQQPAALPKTGEGGAQTGTFALIVLGLVGATGIAARRARSAR